MQATATHLDGKDEYSLYLSRPFKLAVSIYFVFVTIGWIGVAVVTPLFLALSLDEINILSIFVLTFSIISLCVIAWIWYSILSTPYRIHLSPDGQVTFMSILGRKDLNVSEISSIRPEQASIGFLFVRSSRGKVRLLNQFDRFHDFIAKLKSMNPSITIRGC